MQFSEVDPRDVIGLPEGFTEVDPSEIRLFGKQPARSGGMQQVMGIASESDKAARAEADYLADPDTLRKVVVPVPALAASQVVQGVGGKVRQIGEVVDSQGLADWGRDTARMGAEVEQTIRTEEPLREGSWANSIRSGATSTYQQLPTMVAAGPLVKAGMRAAGLATSLLPLGAVTGGQSYQKYRERGFDVGTASAGSAVDELIEVGTELLPMDTALHFATSKAKFGLKQLAGAALKYNGGEYFGETLAMLGQDVTDKYLTDPNLSPEQRQQKIDDYFTKINPKTGNTEAWDNFTETLRTTTAQNVIMMGLGGAARRASRAPDAGDQGPAEQPIEQTTAVAPAAPTGMAPTTPPTIQNESFDEIDDMPAPSGPLQKAAEQAAPVTDPATIPTSTEPLTAAVPVSPAVEAAAVTTPPSDVVVDQVVDTPAARKATDQDQAEFPAAREWAARQMDAGNKALWLQDGETQRDYAWRILETYREVNKPRVLNDSGAVVQPDSEQVASIEPMSELEQAQEYNASLWQSGLRGLMQNTGVSDAQFQASLLNQYRKSQEKANAATGVLPDLQNQRPSQVDGPGLAVPGVQSQVAGVASNNPSSGGTVNDLSSMRQEAVQAQEVPPVRRKDVSLTDISRMTPLDAQAHDAALSHTNGTPEPTQAQIEAGNYKKGHVSLHGLDISIENPAGSVRKGIDETGKEWQTGLTHHYGYIKGTIGKDKDHIDVFIKPGIDQSTAGAKVFVVDQKNTKTGAFDEHKVMLGFQSADEARQAYLSNYDKSGPQRIISVGEASAGQFKQWLKEGNTNKPFTEAVKVTTVAPARTNPRRQLDSSKDSLIVAVAKLGGIARAEIDSQYGNGKDLAHTLNSLATKEAKAGILHVISSKGIPLDRMRESLVEQGYLDESADINALLDKLDSASRGTVHRSTHSGDAGTDAYRAAEIRYSEMINAMTDGEYEEFSRNQWLDEQVQELADAAGIVDEYLDAVIEAPMSSADWSAIANDFKEALDATEFSQGSNTEDQGQVQEDAASEAEGVLAVGKGDGAGEESPAARTGNVKLHEKATAPEHVVTGVNDQELAQIVKEFNSIHDSMIDGDEQVHHLFDAPAKGDVVRLQDNVKVYNKKHGWMTPTEAKARIEEWKQHAREQGKSRANSDKIVLSLFDLSGEWSRPWEEAGYQVYRFDIQDDPEAGDVHKFSVEHFMDNFASFEGQDIYAILAATPCTDFAVSGARHFAAKDADGRTISSVKLVHQTLATIEYFKPSVWALENPVGRIEKLGGLPPWRLSFDPNHLGDPYTKKTLLWGRFNADLPIAPVEPVEGSKMHKKYGGKSLATKNARSATPEGFSYGFFMANNAVDHPVIEIAGKYDRLDRKLLSNAVDSGLTKARIDDLVEDFYYQEMDDSAAEQALRDAIEASKKTTAVKQDKLFATPPKFGEKPQPKTTKGDVSTSGLVDAFTSVESVQPDIFVAGTKPESTPAYGANNTLVTADRAAEIRKKLKAKFDNQINSGIDPEMLSLGTELAIFHIEAGVRKFSAFATAISQDLDVPVHRLREYLRGWYNGARDTIEDKGLSIEGMDDSAEVREAHKALFEEKPAVAPPTRSPQRTSKHRDNLKKMLAAAKTEQGKANWKKRLEALDKKEAEQPPVEAIPENWQQQDNKPEATFKKGDRIQTSAGEHGVISDVYSYTMTSALIDIHRGGVGVTERKKEYRHQYTAKLDNGVEKSLYRFQPETDAAPQVVPAPVYKGKPIDPEYLLTGIKNSKDNAANKRAAASRAKKASSIKEHTDAANVYAKAAVDQQAAFDAWALQYPAEAIKYQKPAEIVAIPSAAESTGEEKAPAGKLQMDIKETVHTKKGHKLFIVKMYDRVERDVYDKLNRDAKRTGNGWDKWSKGFQFLDRESAENFVEKWSGAKPAPVAATKGPKVDYATFMSNVYHTLEENSFLHESAKNTPSAFVESYKAAYTKAITSEMTAYLNKGYDVKEAYESAQKNSLPELADRYRARVGKQAAQEALTDWQRRTIDSLGPVGTRIRYRKSQNPTIYTIHAINKMGEVQITVSYMPDGEHKAWISPGQFEVVPPDIALATPASSDIMVNEKVPTQEAGNEIREDDQRPAAAGESARAAAPAVRGETSGDAGGRGSALQPAGARSDSGNVSRPSKRSDVSGSGRTEEHAGDDGQGDNQQRPDRVRPVAQGLNYRISDSDNLGKGGAKQKARDNITAIRLLKQITQEERPATAEEQAQMVKYVGWGAGELANSIFEQSGNRYINGRNQYSSSFYKEGWEDLGAELKELLSSEEYTAAKKSTVSAFYTPIDVVRGMYRALEQLGFTGGRVLEPGTGVGHFIGLMPDSFLSNTRFTGVELDNTSAAIAKLLYPTHDIRHQGFEKFVMPNGFYDVSVGNPPFVDLDVTSDPDYARHKFKLHDYFFAKAIDKVRPGGLLVFVTSKGTMDKANDKARAYLSERADLLGAIRLPETAFKENAGTETVTDVIFLQKRVPGKESSGKAWNVLKEIKTPDGVTHINEYFADNMSMVLGTNAITSSQYGPKYTVLPLNGTTLAEQFEFAVRNFLPTNVYTKEKTESPADRPTVEFDLAPSTVKEGAFYLDQSGAVLSKESGVGVPVTRNAKDLEVIKSFIPLRDAVRQVLYVQIKGGDLVAAQKDLKKQYDVFVKKHGIINTEKRIVTMRGDKESVSVRTPNFSPFRDDPDAYLVASIEKYDDETNTAAPGPIFFERTIKQDVVPQINSITDALHVVMHEDGVIDIPKIAAHMNVTEAQAIDALGAAIYHNPQTMQWETDDEYLSGNVKQKLALAESTAKADPAFERNVAALKAIQPEDMPPSRMSIGLGEPIVKPEHVQQFAKDVMGMGIKVAHLKNTGGWSVEQVSGYQTTEATSDWGTARRNAAVLIEAALNSRQLRIESTVIIDGQEKKVFDKDATNAANEKLAKIKDRFAQWVWEHPGRSEELSRAYNDAYNNTVKRVYGGDHINKMTFPGMSAAVRPFEHQKRVAWRVVQSGNTYMAHSVGAGKTIGSILAGMELKRLGIKKKPCWVVPNHMLKQFASEFLQLYPAAKIIVADENQFSKENRNRFMGRVAAENWDGVIITHSAFGKMQVSPEFSSQFIQEQIDELEWLLSETGSGDRLKRKQIEQAKLRLEQRLEKVLAATDKDKGVTFEETGIDQLFVDEAHEFRKLDFTTNQTNIKGIDPNGSLMAFDLFVKSRYLEKLYPNRSLVLMSGTPITNTIGEIFTIQRFLQEGKLRELGLDNFDAWASTFGDMATKLEATPGGSYKPVTRFAKFKKLSSLSQLWSEVGDFIHARDLTYIKRPAVKTGGRIIVTGEQSSLQKAYKLQLAARIKAIEQRKRPPQKGDDILLSVITDGRHAALDERYISSGKPSQDNKLEMMASKVSQIWTDTKKDKLTQMIFCDLGMPGSEERRGFSAYNQIKKSLIAQGIPEKEIAFMQDYKKSDEKIKLFRAMNEGKVRVLIGSSEAMGTGVNAQKKLVALHHLDPDTYLPSNIEQREGRIIRQGNSNEEIQLYAYVTRGSYDETMWQFLETKQRFIDQFLSGESTVDEATDVDGGADSFAMARAMSSDNPLILERAGIESDIQRLESLRRAHFDDQQRLKSNASRSEQNLPLYRKESTALENVIARRVDTAGDQFVLTVGSASYDERKKAGEALGKAIDKMLLSGKEQDWHKIGEVAGLDIMARSGVSLKMPWVTLSVGATGTYSSPLSYQGLDSTTDIDAVGLSMKLENLARSFDKILSDIKRNTAQDEKTLADSRERIGRVFEHAQALEDKRNRLNEIETILKAEEQKSDAGAETDTEAGAEDVPRFSQAKTPSVPLTAVKFDAVFARITAGLEDGDRERMFALVDSFAELPLAIQNEARRQGDSGQGIDGVFHRGKVYVVRDNIATEDRLEEVLFHEWHGHAGLQALFGRDINQGMIDLYHLVTPERLYQIGRKHGINLMRYGQGLAKAGHSVETRRSIMTEEMLAHLTYVYSKGPIAAKVREVIGQIRAWLRSHGFAKLAEWGETDIAWLLKKARVYAEAGAGQESDNTVFATGQDLLQRLREQGITDEMLDKLVAGTSKFMTAWHGSPHDHDGFSTEYIGEGEGNQTYGWGLYFAGAKEVAEFYRDVLSRGNALSIEELENYFKPGAVIPSYGGQDKVVSFNKGDDRHGWSVTVHHIDKNGERPIGPEGKNRTHYTMPSAKQYESVTGKKPKLGRLYQVELAPAEDEYLLWDKPLNEQSEYIRRALKEVVGGNPTGEDIYNYVTSGWENSDYPRAEAKHAASEYLHSLGIRGIKYLDGSSRATAGGEIISVSESAGKWFAKVKVSNRGGVAFQSPTDSITTSNGFATEAEAQAWAEEKTTGGNYNYVIFNDQDVSIQAKFSIRRDTEKVATTSTLDKIKHLLNPLDYSRFKESAVDRLPNDATMWLADNLGNPYWVKENNPGAVPFYEEAKDREVTRMDNNIRMFGGLVNNAGQRTTWEKVKDFGNWHEFTTAWGKLRRDQYDKLTDKQKAAYDVIRFEGDAYNKTYETLANALRNPRIKKAGMDAPTFAFYRAALAAEEASFEEKLKIAADNMAEAGIDPEKIKGHIAEYRSRYADLKGWVHRDHGEGDHVVRVYHTIDRLDFGVDLVQHKGKEADRIRLAYFPGVELSRAMEKITEQLGGTFKQLRDGGIVMLFQKGQGEFAAERFDKLQLTNKAGKHKYQVLVYNRFVPNAAAAKKLATEVKKDLAAALPRNFYQGHSYDTSWHFSNKLQEADFQELRTSDMKMEQVLTQAIDKAARKEGLDSVAVESIHEALVQNVAEALLGRGAGLYQIRRANYLIEGYDQSGAVKKYEDYVNGVAGLFSKARYALRQFKNMKSVEPKLRNWATRYVADSLRNMGTGDRLSGNVRAVVSLWYLGFNASWMLVNSTQPLVLGQAELSRVTKNAFAKIVAAEKDVLRGKLTDEEKGILQEHATLTQDRDSMMAEMTGAMEGVGGKASQALHAVTQVSMALGQKVEVLNRHTMIIAAYRVYREKGLDREAAYRKALETNSAVNIDMGRYNLPAWARGPIGRTFYSLQSYIQHMLNYLYNRSSSGNRDDQKAVLRLLFAMFLLGGATAGAPGSDELDKLIQQLFGYSPKLALKGFIRKAASDYGSVGEMLEGFVWRGIPGAFKPLGIGISLTGATQLRLPIISNVIGGDDMFRAVGGPVSGLVTKGKMAYLAAQRGDALRAVEYLLPTALGNVASAIRQSTSGVKTSHGKTVEYKGKPLKMEPQEAALRAFGLQPVRTADISETRGKGLELAREWRDRRQDALDNYRTSRKMKYIQEFNRDLRGSQAAGIVSAITPDSMKQVWGKTDKKKTQWERRYGID